MFECGSGQILTDIYALVSAPLCTPPIPHCHKDGDACSLRCHHGPGNSGATCQTLAQPNRNSLRMVTNYTTLVHKSITITKVYLPSEIVLTLLSVTMLNT